MASLLDICTRAMDDISSFNLPTFIIGNATDGTARSLLAAAQKVGEELVRDYDWQQMIRTATVTTVDADSLYDLEDDYDRLCSDTMWDTTASRRMSGNTTKRTWAAVTNLTGTSLQYRWRLYRDQIQLEPAADGVFSFNYEYLSKVYCTSSGGTDRVNGWVDDTDIPVLPADIFIAGVRYYFAKAKNLPYGDAAAEYDAIIESRTGKNTPSPAVDMSACVRAPGRTDFRPNLPDRVEI